jgi:hypothetical protein
MPTREVPTVGQEEMKQRGLVVNRMWVLIGLILGLLASSDATACEVFIKIKSGEKPVYQTGDDIIFEVTVFLTHHDCPEGIKATKFSGEGVKLLGATKWKEVAQGTYVRLVKTRVVATKNGAGALHARRKCDEEGGYGVIQISVPKQDDEEDDEKKDI